MMKNKNICKFPSSAFYKDFSTICFVLESNHEIMQTPVILKQHRAIIVTKGSGNFKISDGNIPFSTGNLVFAFCNESFCAFPAEECEYIYIDFKGVRSDELFRRFNISTNNREFKGFDGIIPLWRESLSRASEQTIDLASESMLLYTFSRFICEEREHNNIAEQIVAISEEQFTDSKLSITTISDFLGYNPKYLSHIFKATKGIGYSEYLRTLRIKYAVSLFDHGIESVKNVALLSGFTDPLYFSKVFKQTVGVSPKDYRNKHTT